MASDAEPDRAPFGPAREAAEVLRLLGQNLRAIRLRQGLSLDDLEKTSQVSRAMLWQIELAGCAPTLPLLSRISRALGTPLATLLTHDQPKGPAVATAADGPLRMRPDRSLTERTIVAGPSFYPVEGLEVRLAAGAVEVAGALAPGGWETVAVVAGRLELMVRNELHALGAGDSLLCPADVPRRYANPGTVEATFYRIGLIWGGARPLGG
jgi:transcriptional regulator with XRE-family HTH domain